jgi:hypothetical protein
MGKYIRKKKDPARGKWSEVSLETAVAVVSEKKWVLMKLVEYTGYHLVLFVGGLYKT